MGELQQRLEALTPGSLTGIRRGIEKESLRSRADGKLSLTPHPAALGSALTHPHITTDFSESQLELITGVHAGVEACLDELHEVHRFVAQSVAPGADELMWASSMPCGLPSDETIPIGRYGTSNVGRAKSVYRMGLGHRYGRRMQTISGIHYNWSMPGLSSAQYFALIRNFRRHAFLPLVLFGASPAVCESFVEGRPHELQRIGDYTMHMPHGTSLRMGRLGYQSEAQASLSVSYNCLEGYGASLHEALTQPYPAYETIGVRNLGGEYNQLATTLLQIENEFYGTIRPKRTIFPGERPLHALRERGVEYVEVRLMDLDPFEPLGISPRTVRLLDVFLLHCLLAESPDDSPEEIAEIGHNQHLVAARGREPGLRLQRRGRAVLLMDWAAEILAECVPLAAALDAVDGGSLHAEAVRAAEASLAAPQTLPSARVLKAMAQDHGNSFVDFIRSRSLATRDALLATPLPADRQAAFALMAQQSVDAQKAIEAADTLPFEQYREQYVSPTRLMPRTMQARAAQPA
ncbi:glutamate--cysteine ligase [Xylophilus sp. Leaf220]|uniref:glutamate--cysteine ligase n=1 Tax=Xylophilus sp. Leaf220 TaxID=1735686 RepID=UPI0006F809A5|nr:glutamate--cysteine ligase [Xylophilus sp. Leaf220]KQM69736.1 glutamate--cysteine ligase [Xylophilus sp. Leaf220]